jgi:DNA-binding transcriptional MerR regulator
MKFTIERVSKITGLPATTLRNWEKRYGFPRPVRSATGHRFYPTEEVEFLRKVKDWVATGHSLSEIAAYYEAEVSKGGAKPSTGITQAPRQFEDDVDFRTNLMFEALADFDMASAVTHYGILNVKLSPEDVFSEVFEPLLFRVSAGKDSGELSAAQAHFIEGFVRTRLFSFMAMVMPPTQGKRIVLALISDEIDELGLYLVAGHLKFRGYAVQCFGPRLALDELLEAVNVLEPDCFALTFTEPERLKKDISLLKKLDIPVCLSQYAIIHPTDIRAGLGTLPEWLQITSHQHSTEVADFLEMVAHSHR